MKIQRIATDAHLQMSYGAWVQVEAEDAPREALEQIEAALHAISDRLRLQVEE